MVPRLVPARARLGGGDGVVRRAVRGAAGGNCPRAAGDSGGVGASADVSRGDARPGRGVSALPTAARKGRAGRGRRAAGAPSLAASQGLPSAVAAPRAALVTPKVAAARGGCNPRAGVRVGRWWRWSGRRNRTASLEDWGSTIELRPRNRPEGSGTARGQGTQSPRPPGRAVHPPATLGAARCTGSRDVAQVGSASALGAEGRGFESRHPDAGTPTPVP